MSSLKWTLMDDAPGKRYHRATHAGYVLIVETHRRLWKAILLSEHEGEEEETWDHDFNDLDEAKAKVEEMLKNRLLGLLGELEGNILFKSITCGYNDTLYGLSEAGVVYIRKASRDRWYLF